MCCGGISSNNRDITEGEAPYMFRKCLKTDIWNKSECNKDCCSGGRCIATEQGGYCKVNNRYFYYRAIGGGAEKEKVFLPTDEAHSQYPYKSDEEFPYGRSSSPGRPSRHEFDDRRYDRSYAQAQRDIVNRFRENTILHETSDSKESSIQTLTPDKYPPITKVIRWV